MTGTDWAMMQSSAGMLANSDHTHDYSIMHNIESPLENALDKMNNSVLSKCEDISNATSLGLLPCLHQN